MASNGDTIGFRPTDDQQQRINELEQQGYDKSEAVRKLLDIALDKEEAWVSAIIPKLRELSKFVILLAILAPVLMLVFGYGWTKAFVVMSSYLIIASVIVIIAEVLDNHNTTESEV